MHLGHPAVRIAHPLLGVAHGFEIFLDLLYLLVLGGRYFETIDCLQEVDFLVEGLLQGSLPLLLGVMLVVFYLFELSHPPHFKLLVENLEVLLRFGVSPPLNFLLVPGLLTFSIGLFLFDFLLNFIVLIPP